MTNPRRIFVAEPFLGPQAREYVLDCIDSTWISSHGKYIPEFERRFAQFCGTQSAVSTNNGTSALHLVLAAFGVVPGDEVIVPAVTYVATANVVRYCGATPVPVDVTMPTLAIDPDAIERAITPRTRGIIPVHMYGHPVDMDAVNDVAARHGLWVVEDAAEAHGATVRGRTVGSLGRAAAFSFFGNKIVTTGEGGMVTTNDPELEERLRLLRGQGMDPDRRYWFTVVGYNYRMTNIQAALGVAQMERVEEALAARRQVAKWYDEALAGLVEDLVVPRVEPWAEHVYWMYTVFLTSGGRDRRDTVMEAMDADRIETRPVFHPIPTLPPYHQGRRFPVADTWANRGINLPTHEHLTEADVERVTHALASALRKSP